jgi:uncharacterized membrane protein YphA (DoxX/SURF4 family)
VVPAAQVAELPVLLDLIVLSLRLGLAAVFTAASLAKLSDRAGFRGVLLGFGLPLRAATWLADLLPLAELVVAGALILSVAAQAAAFLATALLLVFTIAVMAALATGRRPTCGCFGGSRAIGGRTLARNALLLTAAVTVWRSGAGAHAPQAFESGTAAVLVVGVLTVATYRGLRRRGEELLRRDVLAEVNAEAAAGARAAPLVAATGVVALVAAGTACARPADDLEALRGLIEAARPQLIRSGQQARTKVRAQTPSGGRRARRAAAAALAEQRNQVLELRVRVLALQIQDSRAENARRLAAESLALLAASVWRVQAATGTSPKLAFKQLAQARQLLQEALYRGSRAGLLLKP